MFTKDYAVNPPYNARVNLSMPFNSEPAIAIERVTKRFGDLTALNDFSLTIQQGEFFGLLGPNGAGKSTLINIIAGLARADAGQVAVLGSDVVSDYRLARQRLGVVPQEIAYDPFFTVMQMLQLESGYFGLSRRANQAWLDELLTELDLTDKADAPLRTLSGGMKRRLLIAQALVHKPPVLILDEPTAGVDVELRRTLWKFTQRLHRDGHTIVLTTHYLEEAEALCDRIAVMRRGELKAVDSKTALLNRSPYRVLTLHVASGMVLPDALQAKNIAAAGEAPQLRLHREDDHLGEVFSALAAANVDVQDIKIREPNLEDVFLELTGEAA